MAHLDNVGKEAMFPHTVSLGMRLGTLDEEEISKNDVEPKVLFFFHLRQSVRCIFMHIIMVVLQ
jgi:hypothetical protein